MLRSKVAKLEEIIASKEDQLKTQEEEMQRMEEELAAAKSSMLDNPSVLSQSKLTRRSLIFTKSQDFFYFYFICFLDLKEGLQLLQSIISTAGEQSSPLQDRTRNTSLTASGVQKVHFKFLNVSLVF
jgi:hypothetical protein